MIEETLFIIKPDGYDQRKQIISDISACFDVAWISTFSFESDLVAKLYPTEVDKPHYPALIEYMLETPCVLGIIRGESVIQDFLKFAGTCLNPKECAEDTLRYRYYQGIDRTRSGRHIIKNVIHRSKSKEEFEFYIQVFMSYNIIPWQL